MPPEFRTPCGQTISARPPDIQKSPGRLLDLTSSTFHTFHFLDCMAGGVGSRTLFICMLPPPPTTPTHFPAATRAKHAKRSRRRLDTVWPKGHSPAAPAAFLPRRDIKLQSRPQRSACRSSARKIARRLRYISAQCRQSLSLSATCVVCRVGWQTTEESAPFSKPAPRMIVSTTSHMETTYPSLAKPDGANQIILVRRKTRRRAELDESLRNFPQGLFRWQHNWSEPSGHTMAQWPTSMKLQGSNEAQLACPGRTNVLGLINRAAGKELQRLCQDVQASSPGVFEPCLDNSHCVHRAA